MKTTTLIMMKLLLVGAFYLPNREAYVTNILSHFDTTVSTGKLLFEKHCSKCHGLDGAKGRFGAKNLQKSILTDEQYLSIIQKGKGIMPSWKKKLTSGQISDIIIYIKTLKK